MTEETPRGPDGPDASSQPDTVAPEAQTETQGETATTPSTPAPALETFPPTDRGPKAAEPDLQEAIEAAVKAERQRSGDELIKAKEKMLRVAADFENFRKRARRDQDDAVHSARVEVLKEMLPVFDNLARAVEHGDSVQDIAPILEGAKMVTKQFEENLARFGLKRIKAEGEIFDPMVHEAIAQEESTEVEPGVVLREFLSGYMLGDRLLRASMVVVARAPASGKTGE